MRSGVLSNLGKLYHSFEIFGVKNEQLSRKYVINQKCKAPVITGYMFLALAKSKRKVMDKISFMELFCADGYYAMLARYIGYYKAFGIDNDRDGYFRLANVIKERLGLNNVFFIKKDVSDIDRLEKGDVVANAGGLYHIENPEEVLLKSYDMAKKFLIIQSVVSIANNDENYFESPPRGWGHGCRYSKASFHKMILSKGGNIIDFHFNELEGNEGLEDRGSVYYLIEKR